MCKCSHLKEGEVDLLSVCILFFVDTSVKVFNI